MSILRMGNRVMLVTSEVRIFSLGMRTNRLSKVRILMDSRSMDWMMPVVVPMRITSPTANGFSEIRKRPLMMLDTLVWEAKPRAIPTMPAAPRSAVSFTPSSASTAISTRTNPL